LGLHVIVSAPVVVKAEWTVIYTRYESGASLPQWHVLRKRHILFQIWLAMY